MPQDKRIDERDILEQLPYLNELMVAIRNINDAVLNGKDAKEAAENLLSDLPDDWMQEIKAPIQTERNAYNKTVSDFNRFLAPGYTPRQKYLAEKSIYHAGNNYSRSVKMIVISMLKRKDMLFKTRNKLDSGMKSLVELEGITTDD